MAEINETNQAWRDYHDEQAERRKARREKRVSELVDLLPPGATMTPVNKGMAFVVEYRGARLTFHSTHGRIQFGGKTFDGSPRDVVRLLKKEAGEP